MTWRDDPARKKECLKQYNKQYRLKNPEKRREQTKRQNFKQRLSALRKIDHNLKCIRCGCSDIRFLEINHKNGGGEKENKENGWGTTGNSILYWNRHVDDLELLCKPCNNIHALELKFKEPIPLVTHFINNDWEKEL